MPIPLIVQLLKTLRGKLQLHCHARTLPHGFPLVSKTAIPSRGQYSAGFLDSRFRGHDKLGSYSIQLKPHHAEPDRHHWLVHDHFALGASDGTSDRHPVANLMRAVTARV